METRRTTKSRGKQNKGEDGKTDDTGRGRAVGFTENTKKENKGAQGLKISREYRGTNGIDPNKIGFGAGLQRVRLN